MNLIVRKWNSLMNWRPSEASVMAFGLTCRLLDGCLKAAVILAAMYFLVVVAAAFLPGGPAWRVLNGGR